MNSPASATFDVSSVARATKPLPEVPYHLAVDRLLGEPVLHKKQRLRQQILQLECAGTTVPSEIKEWTGRLKQLLDEVKAGEATASRSIEACSRYHGRLVANVRAHPVISTLHRAFMEHRPVCLSPDMIWLLICQGVAHHVNVHGEKLRSKFVRHQGKARIGVRRDDFIKGSPENPWGEVIDALSLGVRDHIGPAHELFVPHFSTTGPTERIATAIVLLDAIQSYFEYEVHTLCGIPAVTLEGTVEDWQNLADRAQSFTEFDLEWWLSPLQPILREFVSAARGEVRRAFWQSMYKYGSFSGGHAVTGWVAAFFPYFGDGLGNPTAQNPWLAEGGARLKRLLAAKWDRERFDLDGPSLGNFPSGLARAPFVWNYLALKFDMEFLGGFVGVTQDSASLALRPEIGWAIRQVESA